MLVNLIPFIDKTINIITRRVKAEAIEQPIVIKNDFKILLSLDLKPIMIEKSMIEINIKNSTITRMTNNVNVKRVETFSVTIEEIKRLNVAVKLGPAYIIKSEIIKQVKLVTISIKAVKYFELIS